MEKIKKVFIVKNNTKVPEINENAQKSFNSTSEEEAWQPYYLKGKNKQYLQENSQIEEAGIILLFSYYSEEEKNVIQEMYIGECIVNDEWDIEYRMYRHLENDQDENAIKSIIDKIDLDLNSDFGKKVYLNISKMQSLYDELKERICSTKEIIKFATEQPQEAGEQIYSLSSWAQKDAQACRVYNEKKAEDDHRKESQTEFQRDRERIVNSKAFRRMVDKAQIFSAEKGDYYRTRLTHTLEVNQIAKAISFALHLNMDLTEAIALGHDLGHTPFGHQGERTLDGILCGDISAGIVAPKEMLEQRWFGGFKHNYQSAKVLTRLEDKYVEFPGLNVSVQVVDGVLKHTRLKKEIDIEDFLDKQYSEKIELDYEDSDCYASTLEGQVVKIADEIAQRGHDVDDALTSGVMSIDEFLDRLSIARCQELRTYIEEKKESIEMSARLIPDKKEMLIAGIVHRIVNYFVQNVINCTRANMSGQASDSALQENQQVKVGFTTEVEQVNQYLEKIVQKKVICNYEVARADYNAQEIITRLFEKYYRNPRLLHTGTLHKIFIDTLMHENTAVSNSAVNLNDCSVKIANEEIVNISSAPFDNIDALAEYRRSKTVTSPENVIRFEKRRILIRNIVDFIAGMTDGYAMEEFAKLK